MSFVKAYYHIVINTKYKAANLRLAGQDKLYSYLGGIVKAQKSNPIAINGTSNHIHLLIDLSPTVSLSDFMRELKHSSSLWLHNHPEVSKFDSWGKEYYATTVSHRDLPGVKRYIDHQREHHHAFDFKEEMHRIVAAYGGGWSQWMDEN